MIYLVNPSERKILDNAGDRIPIGLLSIASTLRSNGFGAKIYDLNHDSEEQLVEDVLKNKPRAVGISVYTSPIVPEAMRLAKRIKHKTKIIAGGYHATAMPETLRYFDAVTIGEGEESIFVALDCSGTIRCREPKLETLPKPDLSLLDMKRYGVNQSGKRTATLITSRGCPYACSFCFNIPKTVRYEPVEKVKEEIEDLKREGFESLYFLDDVFTIKEDRMDEITKKAYDLKMPFRVTTRANLVDESKIEKLAFNGCDWLSLGIESGDDQILKNSRKGMTVQDNRYAVELARRVGINVKGFFIIGLPGETEQTARKTIDFAMEMKGKGLEAADFYYLTPFPGTPIWHNPDRFGIKIIDRDYTKYLEAGKSARCYVETDGLKSSRIEELVQEARDKWKS